MRIKKIYPDGIHNAIKNYLDKVDGLNRTATLDEPEHGLTELHQLHRCYAWWGICSRRGKRRHCKQGLEPGSEGDGLIVLHPPRFQDFPEDYRYRSSDLKWHEDGDIERLWVIDHNHPITRAS